MLLAPAISPSREAKRLINAADPATGFRDLVHAGLLTGARYGELCALTVRDFHRGKLAIHQSKSGKPRDIVLSDEGVAFFEQLTAGRDPAALMLRQPDGGPGSSQRNPGRCEPRANMPRSSLQSASISCGTLGRHWQS